MPTQVPGRAARHPHPDRWFAAARSSAERLPRPGRRGPGQAAGRRQHEPVPHLLGVEAEHVEPAQHRLGDLACRSARSAGSVDGTTPSATVSPASSASAELVVVARRTAGRGRRRARARRRPRSRSSGVPAAQVCTHGSAPASRDRVEHPLQRLRGLGRVDGAVPAEPGRGRDRRRPAPRRAPARRPGRPAGRRSGTRRRTSATWSRSPSASAWARSRRAPKSASTLSPRGRSTVAASVHGPATWTLNVPVVALGLLLEPVEVLGQQAARPPVVDARTRRSAASRPAAGRRRGRPSRPAPRPVIDAATPRPGTSGR